jgi:hypothetical protein
MHVKRASGIIDVANHGILITGRSQQLIELIGPIIAKAVSNQ